MIPVKKPFLPSFEGYKIYRKQIWDKNRLANSVPVCDAISTSIMCILLYHTLSTGEEDFICRLLLRAQNN
jgi:dTDP-4-amino-4,6-dideoxygalactose transaminase